MPAQWAVALALTVVLVAASPAAAMVGPPAREVPAQPLRYGIGVDGVEPLSRHGVPPDMASLWVGAWNAQSGWQEPAARIEHLTDQGVTPVIQFWYWGDSLRPSCLKVGGCDGRYEAEWDLLTADLLHVLKRHAGGERVIIVLEPEFNKHGVGDREAWDARLAEKAHQLKAGYPAATVVLGFGNWGHEHWPAYDRAAMACDWVGIQSLHAVTRSNVDEYLAAGRELREGARHLHTLFGKPVLVTDVGFSSFPEPAYAEHQEAALEDLLDDDAGWRKAGVVGIVYRSYADDPTLGEENYFGVAERHWGLTRTDGTTKPAFGVWLRAMLGVEVDAPAMPPPPSPRHVQAPGDEGSGSGDGFVLTEVARVGALALLATTALLVVGRVLMRRRLGA